MPYSDSPYGVTLYVGTNNALIPQQTITDLVNLGNSAGVPIYNRWQEQWSYIENSGTNINFVPNYTSPTYDWTNLDDCVSRSKSAGLKFFWAIQNCPSWWNSLDLNGNAVGYDGQIRTTLAVALNAGTNYTQITITPGLSASVPNGHQFQVDYFGKNEVLTINNPGGYPSGTTVLTVKLGGNASWTPAHSHSVGVAIWDTNGAVLPNGTDMAKFATVAVQRYGAQIDWYAIGNEEWDTATRQGVNYISQWDNGGTLLAAVATAVAPLIRTYASSSKVSVCAVRKAPQTGATHVQNWVANFFTAGGGPYTDAIDFHYYRGNTVVNGVLDQNPNDGDTNTPSVTTEISTIQSVITANSGQQIILCTETGWDTTYYTPPAPNPANPVTAAQQNTYQLAMFDAMRNTSPSGKVFPYTMDNVNDPKAMTPTAYTGMQSYVSAHPQWVSSGGGGNTNTIPLTVQGIIRGR